MSHPIDPGEPGVPRASAHATLGASVRVVSLLTIGSRIGGLLRDVATVRLFGDTWIGSAFAAAWTTPNLFRRLFGEGALSAAFLPEYTSLERDDPEGARRFAGRAMRWLVGVTGALTVVVEVLVLVLLLVLPPHQERDLSLRLILVMMPFMPMVCATAILTSMLQTHGRFAPGAAAPILLNGGLVLAAAPFLFSRSPDAVVAAYVLSAATLVMGALQVLWTLSALKPFVKWTRDIAGTREPLRRMLRRFGPVVIGLGTIQINSAIDTAIAMWPIWAEGFTLFGQASPMDEKSNAILTYTQRLYQFPLGVFGIAVATAAFPMLARAAREAGTFMDTLRKAMRLSLFIGVPASVGLLLVRQDLIGVVYTGGNGFSEEGARRSAAVLVGYAVAVWAYSLNHVCTRAFYARGDTRTPMKVAMGAVGLNLALNFCFIWTMREAGLAWATGLSAVAQCVVLLWILARRVHKDVVDRATLAAVVRIVAMSAAMGAAVWGVLWTMGAGARWGAGPWAWGLARLIAGVAAGGVVYVALAAAWRSEELRMLAGSGRGRAPAGSGPAAP